MTRDRFSVLFFFLLLAFFLFQAGRMLAPFFGPLLCALAVAIVCYPMHARIRRWLKSRSRSFQAFVSDLAVLLFIVVPVALVITAVIDQVQALVPQVRGHSEKWMQWLQSGTWHRPLWMDRLPPSVVERFHVSGPDLHGRLQTSIDAAGALLAGSVAGAARNLLRLFFDLLLFQFILFFLFRDGDRLYAQWNELLPLSETLKSRLHQRIQGTVEGVVRGAAIVGLAQGLIAMIGFFIVGADAAVLLGCMTVLASIIPGVGTALVWVPVCLYYFLIGGIWKAVVTLGFGFASGIVDNILRPLVVGQKAEMSLLWLTLAVLGGVQIFGVMGLLLGPLIFGLLPILFEIYRAYILRREV